MDLHQVILRPVVSEKSFARLDVGVYTFVVHPRATKLQIRAAVEEIFNVQVAKVNTLNRSGKKRRNRRSNTVGQTAATKRAMVTLAGDDRIELFEG